MISITKDTTGQYLAKNPLILKVNTDNHILTFEKKASISLSFSGTGPAVNNLLNLSITGEPMLLLGAVAYSASTPAPNTFRVKGPSQTLLQWVSQTFIPDLQNSNIFSSFWTVHQISGFALATIRKKAFGTFNYTSFLANTTVTNSQTNNEAVWRPNYKLRAEIFVEDVYRSDSFALVNTLQQTPDAGGNCVFDVAPSVRAYLQHDVPNPAGSGWGAAKKCQKRFWVRFLEYYGDDPLAYYSSTAITDVLFAFRGGVPAQLFAQDYSFIPIQSVSNSKWLTWLPNHTKKITVDAREYLAFRFDDDDIGTVLVRLFYTDGTTDDFNFDSGSRPTEGDIIIIPAGYEALGIAAHLDSGKTLWKYELHLSDSTVPIYKAFTYIIDDKYYAHRLTLLYQNGWGVPETLHVTQAIDRKLNVSKEQAEKQVDADFDFTKDAEIFDFDNSTDMEFTVNTGAFPQKYIEHLEDLLRSKAPVFMYVTAGASVSLVPISINPGSFSMGSDNDDLYSLTFTFRLALHEMNFGDKEILDTIIPTDESGS